MKNLLLFLVLISLRGFAQLTITVTQTPTYYTPLRDTIFVAGTFNNWNAGDVNYMLIRQPNGTFTITIPNQTGIIELKFTRGAWSREETQLNGTQLANRVVVNNSNNNFTIANWSDMLGWHTAIGNTHIIDLDFGIPQLNRTRRIWIYLPQDYYTTTQNYPVVYAHDAQNLFDVVYTAFGTEWGLDENLKNLEDTFNLKVIAVGIDNGGADRLNEYSPYINSAYGGGQGEEYMNFIANTLKPFIDNNFRTLATRENTAILGSSMGGLISYFGALQNESIFSKAGIFSPSFWFSDTINAYTQNHAFVLPSKYYFVSGTTESTDMVPDINSITSQMLTNGVPAASINKVFRADGQHSEWFWRRELRDCLLWLFNGFTTNANEAHASPKLFNIMGNRITANADIHITLLDLKGALVFDDTIKRNESHQFPSTHKGMFILKTSSDKEIETHKIVLE